MSKGGYQSLFADIDVGQYDYNIQVYNRVRSGRVCIDGQVRQVKAFPNGFWDEESAKELCRYFIHEQGWSKEDAIKKCDKYVFAANCLNGVYKTFGSSTYRVLSASFPEWHLKPWELRSCPNNYWNDMAHAREITLWIADKEKISRNKEVFVSNISSDMYKKYGVHKAVQKNGGLHAVVAATFPEWKIKPWDLKKQRKITPDVMIMATRWLIEEQLHWDVQQVCKNISVKTFYEYGIGKTLMRGANHSPIKALQMAYPGVYTRDMLKNGENPFAPYRK